MNYRVDPVVAQRILPAPFRPLLFANNAIAGVCLIRLEQVRPAVLGAIGPGLRSESAAHRIAVSWNDAAGTTRHGVYIFRRDTTSTLMAFAGGRLFPGVHGRAQFDVTEDDTAIDLDVHADDGMQVAVRGQNAVALPGSSCFRSLEETSSFFERGSLGYSPAMSAGVAEGFCLEASQWAVTPFDVESARTTFYEDVQRFPEGSVEFDHALVMRNVAATWRAAAEIKTGASTR